MPDVCDSCAAVNSSIGISYHCNSFANPIVTALSLSQDKCKVASDELNDLVQMELIKPLQSQKELFPQAAEQIDQAIEEIQLLRLSKVCICTTDGCNDPKKNILDSGNGGGDDSNSGNGGGNDSDSNNSSDRDKDKLVPFMIAISIFMNIAM